MAAAPSSARARFNSAARACSAGDAHAEQGAEHAAPGAAQAALVVHEFVAGVHHEERRPEALPDATGA